jgi:hypothetical protein
VPDGQQEIDKLKYAGNERRAKRARDVSSTLTKLIRAPTRSKEIRPNSPKVTLHLVPRLEPFRQVLEGLDLGHADNRIIAEVKTFAQSHSEHQVVLLTNDGGAMLTADYVGLAFKAVPNTDAWLLAPERDRRIAELERRLEVLEAAFPRICIEMADPGGRQIDSLTIVVKKYHPITAERISELVEHLKAVCPEEDFSIPPPKPPGVPDVAVWQPPSPAEVENYRQSYQNWLALAEDFFTNLPDELEKISRQAWPVFSVKNVGYVVAEQVNLTFIPSGDIRLRESERDLWQVKRNRIRPREVPRGRYGYGPPLPDATFPDPVNLPLTPFRPARRNKSDNHTFYCESHRRIEQSGRTIWVPSADFDQLFCGELWHHADPQEIMVNVLVGQDLQTRGGGAELRCRIHARNMREPAESRLVIRVEIEQGDIDLELKRLIPSLYG